MLAIVVALLFFTGSQPARAEFGLASLGSSFTEPGGEVPATLAAGSHPGALTITLEFNLSGPPGEELPEGSPKDLRIVLPPGMVGAPALLPRCQRIEFIDESCSAATKVGATVVQTPGELIPAAVYLLEPSPGIAARLGFHANGHPVSIELSISPTPPHNVVASIRNIPQGEPLLGVKLTLEGAPGGKPFLTMPRSCPSPLTTTFAATSWEAQQLWTTPSPAGSQEVSGCGSLAYAAEMHAEPTTAVAAAPSGLDLDLDAPDPGISSVGARAAADTSAATLVLPPGMTINPPAAAGLEACAPAELAGEGPDPSAGRGCPEAARIGAAVVTTPMFDEPLTGAVYVAEPDDPGTPASGAENPFDSLLAVYLVVRSAERGLFLALPIRIEADPLSGRLTARFTQIPPLPISHLSLRFNSGSRAPLSSPESCGSHAIAYSLTPSSGNPPLTGQRTFAITSGCDAPFEPGFSAGTTSPVAGIDAPFVVELRNGPAAPNLRSVRINLPPGLAADLTAAATCPQADTSAATCPGASRVGHARLAFGTGPDPLWVPDGPRSEADVYLAGPYRGAPFSLLFSVPALAGPFDFGRVVLRGPLRIDPDTAQVSVEVDDLPQILDGIPLHYRAIRLVLDSPGFIRNPTSCEPMQIVLEATAANGARANDAGHFQAVDCGSLGFRPRLAVRLLDHLRRNGHPKVVLRLTSRAGQANLAAATFSLPAGELLDTRRIRALCPRQLSPGACPAASRIGRAVFRSPLLPEPMSGQVFLRSPSGKYPDLISDLNAGEFRVRVHGRTASARGGRLRIRLDRIPDIPLSSATITLAGGRRGIIVNSASLCRLPRHATVLLRSHSGKETRSRPRLLFQGRC